MSGTGRPTAWTTVAAATLLAILVVAPGAAALGSVSADLSATAEETAQGLDVAAEAAAQAAVAGVERTVEASADPAPVPTPEAADDALPDVDHSLDPELSSPDWSPVDAEASASVDASTEGASADDPGTQGGTVANGGPAISQEAAVAAGFVAILGALAAFWTTAKTLAAQGLAAAVPMFSRLDRDDVLENETRKAIYEAITEDPGLCTSELCDRVDAAWGTAVYHLKVLEDKHFIVSLKHGRHRRFFENGGKHKGEKEAVATLQNETTADVYDTIRSEPGLPQKEIADRVDLTPQALAWHLNRLKEVELLEKERDGRVVRHYTGSDTPTAPA